MIEWEQYAHTLIPLDLDWLPQPGQIAAFLDGLVELGSAPLQATFRVGQPSTKPREGHNIYTGEVFSVTKRDWIRPKSTALIAEALDGIDDYAVIVSGKGPPPRPPFSLLGPAVSTEPALQSPESGVRCRREPSLIHPEFRDVYGFDVHCQLRPEMVSTSCFDSKVASSPGVPFFGERCDPKKRTGTFQHPCTAAIIDMPYAGCGRFWIAFEFGKWLFPQIEDTLNVLDPLIVACAEEKLKTQFVQGCYYL